MRKKIVNSQILRINKACACFTCHKGLEDCTFCYCPFYPCLNEKLGSYIFSPKTKRYIWSCTDCVWIHKKKVVDNILKLIKTSHINPKKINRKLKVEDVGIIILAHGSKVRKANETVNRIIRQIRKYSSLKIVEPSYLQLSNPSLAASVKKVTQRACKKIVIVPFFLFMGNHVGRDIPKEIARQARLYPDVEFVYARNIGCDVRISDIVLDCIREAL